MTMKVIIHLLCINIIWSFLGDNATTSLLPPNDSVAAALPGVPALTESQTFTYHHYCQIRDIFNRHSRTSPKCPQNLG